MSSTKPYTVLITGAASGLGLCFTQHYLRQPNTFIIAADVNEINMSAPAISSEQHGNPSAMPEPCPIKLRIDMSSTTSVQESINSLTQQHNIAHLDLIVHSAGIRGLVPSIEGSQPDNVAAAETLHGMDAATMLRTYQINTLGTFTLLQSLLKHNLLRPVDSSQASKVVIMTSRMGSLSYNTAGGGYAYRASKAALNAIVKSLSIDEPGVIFALVHPGRVESGLTKCREEGAIEADESVRDMLVVMDGLGKQDSGRFMDRFGKDIEW